jgi:hypothetical protein
MASYAEKEISEWNSTDLSNWLLDNKYRGISELCQKYSLSGYDLFFITDDILKNELGLSSFHERVVTLKLINKLTSEHLKLNIINSNGDNVILTLDNNHNTSLKDISEYIGNMFNIEPNFILYKDNTKQEVLSPTLKIIKLMILYPRIYKTLNISNMKDYHQLDDKIINNENTNYQRTNTINKTGETLPRMADNMKLNNELLNINKNEIKNDIPIVNNSMYSFGDNNNRELNNNMNLNNKFNIDNSKYERRYQDMQIQYKPQSEMSETNQNSNILINNNGNINEERNSNNLLINNINNNIAPANMGANVNDRKYKSEKRIYREKNEIYFNNMPNGPNEFGQNTGANKGIGTTSSSEDENGEDEMNDNMRNNYGMSMKNNNNNYRNYGGMNEDINNNYYIKDNYGEENRMMNNMKRGGYSEVGLKGKNFNDNFNDNNPISNEYYK